LFTSLPWLSLIAAKLHNLAMGQRWGNASFRPELPEPGRDRLEVVIEEIRVGVQSHGRGRMPEHPLNGLHVRSGADGEARRRVPQLVRSEPGSAGRRRCPIETTRAAHCGSAAPRRPAP
jgi:hypothetical protein